MAVKIQLRGDTAANWTSVNPTPSAREFCIETDTGKLKVGNGASNWAALAYFTGDIPLTQDEIDAIDGANAPDGANVFATLADIIAKVAMVDNALVRANGPNGQVQGSGVKVNDVNAVSGAGLLSSQIAGTAYELLLTDAGTLKVPVNAAATVITIPANSAVAFPVDTIINFMADGAGPVSFVITDDTLNSKDGNVKLTGQYSAGTLWKKDATTWVLFGDLSA